MTATITDAELARYEAEARAELDAQYGDRELTTQQITDVLGSHGFDAVATQVTDAGEVQAWMECAAVHDHSGHAPDGWESVPTSLVDLLLWLGY